MNWQSPCCRAPQDSKIDGFGMASCSECGETVYGYGDLSLTETVTGLPAERTETAPKRVDSGFWYVDLAKDTERVNRRFQDLDCNIDCYGFNYGK